MKADATGAYAVVVEGIDAAGNTVKWNETIRIDKINPEIKSFTFTEPGLKEGQSITKSDDYEQYGYVALHSVTYCWSFGKLEANSDLAILSLIKSSLKNMP